MQLAYAKKLSSRVIEVLEPHCERIFVAGSIRRQKATCGDIEIVCTPKRESVNTSLFGDPVNAVTNGWVNALAAITDFNVGFKGKPNGRYMQLTLRNTSEILDLFMPVNEDFYRIYAIRTGSAEYAERVLATAWRRLGWCGVAGKGLWRIKDCVNNKGKWALVNPLGDRPPVWTSEEDFFRWLGVEWILPQQREFVNPYPNKHKHAWIRK